MESILFGINVLILMAVWRFMLRKTILDHHRDQLFDLRDDLRKSFIKNGWDINSPTYKHLRDLINGYLRFTEDYSFIQFSYLNAEVKVSKGLEEGLKQKIERSFKGSTEEQKEFIRGFRCEALQVMTNYMIVSSGPLFMLTMLMIPVVIVCQLIRIGGLGAKAATALLFGKVAEFQNTLKALVRFSVAAAAHLLLKFDFVEEYSYRCGMAAPECA